MDCIHAHTYILLCEPKIPISKAIVRILETIHLLFFFKKSYVCLYVYILLEEIVFMFGFFRGWLAMVVHTSQGSGITFAQG